MRTQGKNKREAGVQSKKERSSFLVYSPSPPPPLQFALLVNKFPTAFIHAKRYYTDLMQTIIDCKQPPST